MRREGTIGNTGEAIRLTGKGNLILDVGSLAGLLAGRHLEALNDAREDDQQDERRPEPGDQRRGQQREARPARIDQQADGNQHHQHRHDPVGRDTSGHVRIPHAVDEAAPAQQELVEVEPVMDGEQQGKGRRQH